MDSRITWLEFLAGCIATFRLALLVSKEDGPADAMLKAREAAPPGWIKKGLFCEWCQSFWWGLAASLFFTVTDRISWTDFVVYGLAFSGAGIVLNQAFTKN